jgi:hypothetical protein
VALEGEVLTLALIHLYYPPDLDLLDASSNTLWVCDGPEAASPQVIDVRVISSVVGMVPFDDDRVFAVHKMGLEVGSMTGQQEPDLER